jgi:hypothetical protein
LAELVEEEVEQTDLLVPLVHKVILVLLQIQALLVTKVLLDIQVQLVLKGMLELLQIQALLVTQDLKV